LQAVEHRHAHVHEDHVGAQTGGLGDGLPAVHGLADDLDVGLGVQQHGEPGPHHALVVGHHHADRHAASSGSWSSSEGLAPSGSPAGTRTPLSAAGPASRCPPSMVPRSRMPMMPCPPPPAPLRIPPSLAPFMASPARPGWSGAGLPPLLLTSMTRAASP